MEIISENELNIEEKINPQKPQYKYYYRGPVYHFEYIINGREPWQAYTMAVSKAQAINNIKMQAKKEFGFAKDARLEINDNDLQLVDDDKFLPTCPECGELLLDNGECPKCNGYED